MSDERHRDDDQNPNVTTATRNWWQAFTAIQRFDFNGWLGRTSDHRVWYVNDLHCYEVGTHLWKDGHND